MPAVLDIIPATGHCTCHRTFCLLLNIVPATEHCTCYIEHFACLLDEDLLFVLASADTGRGDDVLL
jgi:hypothetical protein